MDGESARGRQRERERDGERAREGGRGRGREGERVGSCQHLWVGFRVDGANFKLAIKIICNLPPPFRRFQAMGAPRCVEVDQPVPFCCPLFPVGILQLVDQKVAVVKVFGHFSFGLVKLPSRGKPLFVFGA